jgi:hypothetical protein
VPVHANSGLALVLALPPSLASLGSLGSSLGLPSSHVHLCLSFPVHVDRQICPTPNVTCVSFLLFVAKQRTRLVMCVHWTSGDASTSHHTLVMQQSPRLELNHLLAWTQPFGAAAVNHPST